MTSLFRSRWAAIGAAVAVTLGGGGLIGVSAADTSSTLVPIAPVRVLDTRASDMVGDINDGASITVQVTGSIATVSEGTKTVVPSGASAITGNMTLVSTTSNDYGGFATIYPCGTRPDASNINFTSGQTVANSVAVPLSTSGTVCIYVFGTAHVLLDVSGYYTKSEISDLADRVTTVEASDSRLVDMGLEPLVAKDSAGNRIPIFVHGLGGWTAASSASVTDETVGPIFVLKDGEYWQVRRTGPWVDISPGGLREYFLTSDCSGDSYRDANYWESGTGKPISEDGASYLKNSTIGTEYQRPFVATGGSIPEGEFRIVRWDLEVERTQAEMLSMYIDQTDTCYAVDNGSSGTVLTRQIYSDLDLGITFPLNGVAD